MADLTGPIHAAIYAALQGSPPVVARLYDLGNVPPVPTYPYVVLGPYLATDADDKGADGDDGHGDDFAQTIDVWTRGARGKKNAEEIMAAIYAALHDVPLVLAGSPSPGTMVTMRCRMKQVFLDADGLSLHGVMRFEGYAHT